MEDTYEDLTEAPKPEYLEINSDYIYPTPDIAVGEEGIDKASQTRQNSKCSRKVLLISLLAVISSLGVGGCIGWFVTNTTIGQQITTNEMKDDIGSQTSTSAASITKSTTILNVVSTASPTPTLQPNECIFDQNGVCDPTLDYWCLLSGTLLCKPNSDGWLVWFRRVDDTIDFKERNWTECTQGFGDPNGNYWLGLEKLHLITGTFEPYKMRVELESWSHPYVEYAEYDSFYIKNKESNYEFHISGFTGNTSVDALFGSGGLKFSATDKDNDYINDRHCAQLYGPWWHDQPYCSTNINAMQTYGGPGSIGTDHMSWNEAFAGLGNSRPPLKSILFKITLND